MICCRSRGEQKTRRTLMEKRPRPCTLEPSLQLHTCDENRWFVFTEEKSLKKRRRPENKPIQSSRGEVAKERGSHAPPAVGSLATETLSCSPPLPPRRMFTTSETAVTPQLLSQFFIFFIVIKIMASSTSGLTAGRSCCLRGLFQPVQTRGSSQEKKSKEM